MAQSGVSAPGLGFEEKEALRQRLLDSGFHKVGFTDANPMEWECDFLEKRGPGPFEPTELPPRTDPGLLLADARSVIAVAMSYHHQDPERPSEPSGRLSRYCRGYDYHNVMLSRLEEVAQEILLQHGSRSVCYVDTGPPLERAFAQKAGLGRISKNTNLIVPKLGSWVFLGIMITELEIPADQSADYAICGSCTLCLEACPTGCLSEWILDSENCLGYLNQKSDEVPEEHRESMGDWLFGCDICQQVCPHNVKAPTGLSACFEPLPKPGAFPLLAEIVGLTEEQFEEWFKPTAADWRGREALQRNALIALGNSDDEKAVEVLLSASPSEPVLSEHAVWAAAKLAERFPTKSQELQEYIRVYARSDASGVGAEPGAQI